MNRQTKCVARRPLLVSAAALAAGCAVGPRYHRPAAPANAGYAPAPLPRSAPRRRFMAGRRSA
jgi:outer membrane protein TolC